jgi:peptide/nickel transport system substrate-binding protein
MHRTVPGVGLFQVDSIYGASRELTWKPDAQQSFFVADMRLRS